MLERENSVSSRRKKNANTGWIADRIVPLLVDCLFLLMPWNRIKKRETGIRSDSTELKKWLMCLSIAPVRTSPMRFMLIAYFLRIFIGWRPSSWGVSDPHQDRLTYLQDGRYYVLHSDRGPVCHDFPLARGDLFSGQVDNVVRVKEFRRPNSCFWLRRNRLNIYFCGLH